MSLIWDPNKDPGLESSLFHKSSLMYCGLEEQLTLNGVIEKEVLAGVDPRSILNFLGHRFLLQIPVCSLMLLYTVKALGLFWLGKGSKVCWAAEGRRQTQTPSLIQNWASFQNPFPTCSLWPAVPLLGNVPVNLFPIFASGVVVVSPVWGWSFACHSWDNSWPYPAHFWMVFVATFISESRLKAARHI